LPFAGLHVVGDDLADEIKFCWFSVIQFWFCFELTKLLYACTNYTSNW
jgi:hypothetical protein